MLKSTPYADGAVTRFDLARTILGRGRYWTSAYLVDGLLIDTGCAHTAPELVSALSETVLDGIVNTHSHEDHIGANGVLQRQRAGLTIRAHPLALPILADPRNEQPLQRYRRFMWGWPAPSHGRPIADGDLVETGRYRFRVLHTPGHSPDHVCLYEPAQGWLFTGDLFIGGQDRALGSRYDIWAIIASLKRIAALPATVLFPAAARVRENPAEALTEKIAYLEGLGEKILALHERGWRVPKIVHELLGGPLPMGIEIATQGHFSRRWLVLSYLNSNQGENEKN
ncbi:MAG TPA: MBL fold metallo-hydrolase [Chloroflexi bacterium]|nr:MBL fold metallo-hydrolase [Chloroflexota bacterium]